MRDNERVEIEDAAGDLSQVMFMPECTGELAKKITLAYRRLVWALDIDNSWKEMPAIAWEIEHQEI